MREQQRIGQKDRQRGAQQTIVQRAGRIFRLVDIELEFDVADENRDDEENERQPKPDSARQKTENAEEKGDILKRIAEMREQRDGGRRKPEAFWTYCIGCRHDQRPCISIRDDFIQVGLQLSMFDRTQDAQNI
jgi:hypothetical protein